MLRGGIRSQTAKMTASRGVSGDQFGRSVALSAGGSTALVGAPGHNSYAGAAYVFTLRGGIWSQTAELTASHAAHGDEFGSAVALSSPGSTALAGAPDHNSKSGAAYVFTLRCRIWSQAAELTALRAARGDLFGGFSEGLSALDGTILIGAQGHNSDTGVAYVFTVGDRA